MERGENGEHVETALLRRALRGSYPFPYLGALKLSVVSSVIESGVLIGGGRGSVEYADEMSIRASSD
jgi:hypothetical protein